MSLVRGNWDHQHWAYWPVGPLVAILTETQALCHDIRMAAEMFEKENVHVDLGSSDRLGPDSGAIPTQIQLTESNNKNGNYKFVPVSFYAGSAFITSPPPSSVPMPAFFTKMAEVSVKNNDATSDLRRILRLD
ncbi:uncharacterized protein LOC120183698 [Hibiscus syriacus]|uniref:uncharacterized protein LOC120183698 n=1 Tax=Hibiscus syriacus TaxID=106335 RepID=UPI001922CF0E|nr:uncharacterized protein LOC120183698 [Hibiscus syriacus]